MKRTIEDFFQPKKSLKENPFQFTKNEVKLTYSNLEVKKIGGLSSTAVTASPLVNSWIRSCNYSIIFE